MGADKDPLFDERTWPLDLLTAIAQEANTEEFEENDQGDGTRSHPQRYANAIYFQNRLHNSSFKGFGVAPRIFST